MRLVRELEAPGMTPMHFEGFGGGGGVAAKDENTLIIHVTSDIF